MWNIIVNIVLGAWLIAMPSIFSMKEAAANNNYVTGPLVITFCIIALWRINVMVHKVNMIIAAWLIISLFILPYSGSAIVWNAITAVLILLLSLKKQETGATDFGGGWHSLFEHNPYHLEEADRLGADKLK